MQNPTGPRRDCERHEESHANARASRGRGARIALGLALAVGASFLLASPASAKNEFENGFKDELGRITAHEVAFIGRGVIGQVIYGGVITTAQNRGGRGGRGAYGGPGGHGGGGGHHVQPHYVQPRRVPHYAPRRPARGWFGSHGGHGHGHGRGHFKASRGHRHGRHCHH